MAFLVSLASAPAAAWLALRLNIVDHPNARKVHVSVTPLLGGLSLVLGLFAGFLTAHICGLLDILHYAPAQGLLLGTTLMFLLGLLDDILGVSPRWKLAGQALAACVLIFFEIKLSLFIRDNILATIITIVWIVGITNSFNLLDNMNGLSSGVGLIAAVFFGWVAFEQRDLFVLPIAAALAGSALGFLPHNFPRARLFLGDAGSLIIGYVLAAISVQGIYLADTQLTHLPVITPILILGVPLFDTLSVIVIRLSRGVSIFTADKNHFSHRLVDLGMTHKQAVLLVWLVAIQVALPATLLTKVSRPEAAVLLVQELILFGLIVALMRAGMVRGDARDHGLPPPTHEEDRER